MKSINFVLGSNADIPVGGYKIVFQYANELVKRGYEVSISFLFNQEISSAKRIAKNLLKPVVVKLGSSHKKQVTWFALDPKTQLYFDVTRPSQLPDADVIFATAAQTVDFVTKLSRNKGAKYYFIQSYEDWAFGGSIAALEQTYKSGMTNIVISNELSEKVSGVTADTPKYLPNFYDPNEFFLTTALDQRQNVVSLLNHTQSLKRTAFGLSILTEVKKSVPDLRVELFGASQPIEPLPDWVHFSYKASALQLREIYNKSKVYLLASEQEGWGLTGMEAMACGAALVSGEIGGVTEYATKENSLLVDKNDGAAYVDAITRLLTDDEKRQALSHEAQLSIQKYSLSKASDRLEEIIA